MSAHEPGRAPSVLHVSGSELLSSDAAQDIGARVVTSLFRSGVSPRSTVVFQAPNSATLLAGIYGALLSELAPVVISEKLNDRETREILSGLPESMIITEARLAEFARPRESETDSLSENFACRPIHFTSGTSGKPKGVWGGWLSNVDADALAKEERDAWGLLRSDVHLVSGPLSHSAPLRFALNTLLNGGQVVVPARFEPSVISGLLLSGLVTTSFMAPVHMQRLFDAAPPSRTSLRLLAHAGSPCPDQLRLAAIDCFGLDVLYEFYGSTEGQFTLCSAREWQEHPGTVGRARLGREIRIDDDGRIWCKVPPFARFEYWGDPRQTSQAWNGSWFTVGDLGRLDEDGYLYLEGRRTDLIISGGVNVYPAEVERVLSELHGVSEIAVFGIDDVEWGQRVCAVYVGSASEQSVFDYCHEALAPPKRPKSIVKVAELPITHQGKVDRGALASLVET